MAIDTKYFSDQYMIDAFTAVYNHSLNCLLGSPELAPGGTDTNYKVSAFHYKLGGIAYYKAAADNIAAPGVSTTAGQYKKCLLSIDTAGTITVTGGTAAASQALAELPACPDGELPIATFELAPSFTSGTTSLTAGMCVAYTETIDLTPNG